jgi:hypothetical protein
MPYGPSSLTSTLGAITSPAFDPESASAGKVEAIERYEEPVAH